MTPPPPLEPAGPDPSWEHYKLWDAVRKTVFALPSQFESELVVSGVLATDLFAFNSSLGATVEEQVVASLNNSRAVWDPVRKYGLYSFERQPQTFPDVVLRASEPGTDLRMLMGYRTQGLVRSRQGGRTKFPLYGDARRLRTCGSAGRHPLGVVQDHFRVASSLRALRDIGAAGS